MRQCPRKLDEISENPRGYIEAGPWVGIQLHVAPFTWILRAALWQVVSRNLFLMAERSAIDPLSSIP